MKNTIICKQNFIVKIISTVMALITISTIGMTSVIKADAAGYSGKDVWFVGSFPTDDPTDQDKNYRRREIRGLIINYEFDVVTGIQAIFSDGSQGIQLGSADGSHQTRINFLENDYFAGITYNYNVKYNNRSDAIANLRIYTKNGLVFGPFGYSQDGTHEETFKDFSMFKGSELRAVGLKASCPKNNASYLTGLGIMLTEKSNLDKDDKTAAQIEYHVKERELEERANRMIHVKIDIGAGYYCRQQQFYGRKIVGVDQNTGEYILGNWQCLRDTNKEDDDFYVTADFVEFGYSFDIKGGTNWPYSGIFWQGSTDEIQNINITTGGTCRRASITIKVDGKQVLHHGNCASHKHYNFH